jgi:hypothetical protein
VGSAGDFTVFDRETIIRHHYRLTVYSTYTRATASVVHVGTIVVDFLSTERPFRVNEHMISASAYRRARYGEIEPGGGSLRTYTLTCSDSRH